MKVMSCFAIIGAGNAGCAFAAHLNLLGHQTRLYDVVPEPLAAVSESGNKLILEGEIPVSGEARVELVTTDLGKLVEGADLILCTSPAHTHMAVALELAKYLEPGQMVMLNPGRTCGALEVKEAIAAGGGTTAAIVIEAQTLLYACRRQGNRVHVFGVKETVACAGFPGDGLAPFFDLLQPILPQFVNAEQGIWQTSLDNIGMLFHPAPTLLNLARMETGVPFDYYHEGMSPTVAFLVEQLDAERCAVARAMGVTIPTALEWLKASYGTTGNTLHEAIQNNRFYAGIKAPQLKRIDAKKGLRYVVEDVPSGLVPVSQLGSVFGVPTPVMNLVIDLADTLFERNFRESGRNLDRLGLAGKSREEILRL